MRNTLIVISIILASLLSLKAEPLNDPDFEQFFARFQQDLAKNNIGAIADLVTTSYMLQRKDYGTCYSLITMSLYFCTEVRSDIDKILKLSPKNSYTVVTKSKDAEYCNWEVFNIEKKYAKELFGLDVAYQLAQNVSYEDGGSSIFCTFGKIRTESGKLEWRIIDFDGAG